MMNIGSWPAFEGTERTLEVQCFDFDEEIYGKTIAVEFVERIRDEQEFDGVEELVEQLERNKKESLEILGRA